MHVFPRNSCAGLLGEIAFVGEISAQSDHRATRDHKECSFFDHSPTNRLHGVGKGNTGSPGEDGQPAEDGVDHRPSRLPHIVRVDNREPHGKRDDARQEDQCALPSRNS